MDGTGEPSDRQMPTEIILLVPRSNDSKFGEIIVLDEPRKVESTIEALLEVGFEQERIRLFTVGGDCHSGRLPPGGDVG